MEEQRKEDEAMESQFDNEDDDDDFDPFLHATVPRNLYHKFQTEGSKRWGPPTEILPFLFLGSCFCANEEVLLRDLGVDHILNVAEECPPPPTVASRKDKGEKLVKHYMMVDVVEHIRKSENQWNTFESCFNFIDKARVAYEAKYGGGKKRKGSKRMKRPGGAEERGERKSSGMKIKKLSLRAGKDRDKERETATSAATGDATLTGPASDRVLVHCMHGRSRSATIVLAYLMKKEGWTLRQAYVHVKLRRPIVGPDNRYLKHQLIEYEQHLFGKSSFQSVEEFRDYQLLLTPELVLKEKERKQKLKEEEARQQEQSCSSNDDNTTKLDDVEQQADADEEEPSGKEITADGEAPEGEALEGDDAEEEVSSSPRTPSAGAATGDDEEEGKGSGKKKKKKKKKSKKASEDEETDGANGEEKTAAKKAKKSKKKDKAAGGTPLTKRKKKRQEGGTSSSGGSAAGSPRGDDVAGVNNNNEEPRKRANSASAAPAQGTGGRASRSNTATKMA